MHWLRIIAEVRHGVVVRHLKEQLEALGYQCARDGARDLYIPGKPKMLALFEVKTDANTTSIYGAIWQLLFHGKMRADQMIAVLPAPVEAATVLRLRDIDVATVTYRWEQQRPVFDGLANVL